MATWVPSSSKTRHGKQPFLLTLCSSSVENSRFFLLQRWVCQYQEFSRCACPLPFEDASLSGLGSGNDTDNRGRERRDNPSSIRGQSAGRGGPASTRQAQPERRYGAPANSTEYFSFSLLVQLQLRLHQQLNKLPRNNDLFSHLPNQALLQRVSRFPNHLFLQEAQPGARMRPTKSLPQPRPLNLYKPQRLKLLRPLPR